MTKFFPQIFGLQKAQREIELADRLNKSGAKDVEVVGRGAVLTSKEDLASSETVRLMRFRAKEIVAQSPSKNKEQ
ncbi:hypothetical protein [Rahnella aceris]